LSGCKRQARMPVLLIAIQWRRRVRRWKTMHQKVLIIEDDSVLLRGLVDNYQSQGYRVIGAKDGRQGLDAALKERPDLIILDIMLPKLNGYEVCRLIRRHELNMPIIMLTAKGQEEDIIRGLELGADDYVTKPFGIRELLARSKAFLRRLEAKPTEVHRFGDCELNLSSHKLFRNGEEAPLTAKEFRLLEYFVRRAGRALTRNDILDAVWGHGIIVTGRSVDRCVTTLRAKIEPNPQQPTFIRTIRDIGYRFETPE
jgi:DNA-binding response OmpR family regulator